MADAFSTAEPIEVPTPIYEPAHEPFEEDEHPEERQHHDDSSEPYDSPARSERKQKEGAEGPGVAGILLFVALALQAIVFILTVVATPLDVLKNRSANSYIPDSQYRACYSMWGYKRCGAHKNRGKFEVKNFYQDDTTGITIPASGYVCTSYRSVLRTASAFSIISIVFTLVTLVLAILYMCKVLSNIIPAIFAILSAVFLLICWACIAGTFYRTCNWDTVTRGLVILTGSEELKSVYSYGPGFGVMVAAWCVEVVVAILLFFV